mmetsp:Transcript_652/g.1468  ORF Transcript_652/g.1468 Transcript_652/m.1468 type:complete len:334 (-) Transcript_652:32-1033(-)
MAATHGYGATLAFLGVLAASTSPLLLRLASEQQPGEGCAQFYKMLLKGISLFIANSFMHNGVGAYLHASKQLGSHFLAGACALGLYYVLDNWANVHTSVANAGVLRQLSPCWSAILGVVVFQEKPPGITLVAILIAVMCGCMILVSSGHVEVRKEGGPESLAGDLAGLLAGFCLALYFTVVNATSRKYPNQNLVGSTTLAALIAALVFLFDTHWSVGAHCWPMDGIIGWRWTVLSGAGITPLAITLPTLASRYCSATVVTLFYVLNSTLASLWAWIVLNEVPHVSTIVCGTILLITLGVHELVLLSVADESISGKAEKVPESESTPLLPEHGA